MYHQDSKCLNNAQHPTLANLVGCTLRLSVIEAIEAPAWRAMQVTRRLRQAQRDARGQGRYSRRNSKRGLLGEERREATRAPRQRRRKTIADRLGLADRTSSMPGEGHE